MAGVALILALLATGCAEIVKPRDVLLRAGFDTRDGTLAVWPARGALIGEADLRAELTDVVGRWRSPIDDRVYLPTSGILWAGELDGARLALVAADVPGPAGSWLLQLTDRGTGFEVVRAAEYTDPGYLVYSDVLPVFRPDGRRYLTSARVQQLLGPDGQEVPVTDGLSAPVPVPPCTAVPLTVQLRPTSSLPNGNNAARLLDLGTGTADPRYPIVDDEGGTGAVALDGLDTCALGERTGPFGSLPQRVHDREHIDLVPDSWPIDRIRTRPLAEVDLDGAGPGRLDQLSWRTDTVTMSAVVYRPARGPAVFSPADRLNPLQTYELAVPGRPAVVLVWRDNGESSLSLPAGRARRVDQPGVVVLDHPQERESYRLATGERTIHRSVDGLDD